MEYNLSKHSVYNINYHIVFCPKRRKAVLVDDIAKDLFTKLHEISDKNGFIIHECEVMPDHVHLFISCKPTTPPHKIVKELKGGTSKFLRETYPQLTRLPCMWSRSYYIGTVGFVSESVVREYIKNQKGK